MQASVVAPRRFNNRGTWALDTYSIVIAHGLSCSVACGIFLDQELNVCLLQRHADSLPLTH